VVAAFASLHLMAGEAVEVSWWAAMVQVCAPTKASLKVLSQEPSCSQVEAECQVEYLRTNQSRRNLE